MSLAPGPVHAANGSPLATTCGPGEAGWNRESLGGRGVPVDLSSLNEHPAGSHGFLGVRGEDLAFQDGTPVRFWGTNVAAHAVFRTSDDGIRLHSRRIAQLGFNLVRLHHHDSMAWVNPSAIDRRLPHSLALDPRGMAKLDLWISELKRNGVYVWLDLHTGRLFRAADQIPGYQDLLWGEHPREGKGFIYLNTRLQELLRSFNNAYLSHVNPLTGLAYKDDPVIVGVLLSNEDDLTEHYAHLLRNPLSRYHNPLFANSFRLFFAQRHDAEPEDLDKGRQKYRIKLWLNELEHRFNRSMREHLRGLGFRGIIATTSLWGRSPLHSLPALTDGDVIDAHAYAMPYTLRIDPRRRGSYLSRIATAQISGRPLTISEWNVKAPLATERYAVPLQMAAISSLQGWDAPILYGYADQPLDRPTHPLPWTSFKDPAVMGLMPAAALMYRGQHVSRARRLFVLAPTAAQLLSQGRAAPELPALRTVLEQSRVAIQLPRIPGLPWLVRTTAPRSARVLRDLGQSFIPDPPERDWVGSDTGELRRDWSLPLLTIDTPLSVAAVGHIGTTATEGLRVGSVRLRLESAEGAIVLSSLDGIPLTRSSRILVSAIGPACPEPGHEKLAFRSQPIVGTITLRRDRQAPRLSWRTLEPSRFHSSDRATASFEASSGPPAISLELQRAHWYLLSAEGAALREAPPSDLSSDTQSYELRRHLALIRDS